jgi:hypothetical protein
MPADYEVGYGRPPRNTRFRKGQSGNSQGRPKRTRNLKTDLIEELRESILVREGSRERHISKQRALLKSLTAKAIKGDAKAASIILNMVLRILEREEVSDPGDVLDATDRAILERYSQRIVRPRPPAVAAQRDGARSRAGATKNRGKSRPSRQS